VNVSTDFPDAPLDSSPHPTPGSEYLPDIYVSFRRRYADAASALDSLASAADASGPLDSHTRRLVKLGIAVGAVSRGAVRSNARKALSEGASPDEIRHVALLATTTSGFPTTIATLGWIDEVLDAES
jgi:4-carboxymuconolactone decarboxylase